MFPPIENPVYVPSKTWDDAYDEKIDKTIRVIKTYELHELSIFSS